jgi:phospholipid/cholesterol/gamma-HCH transport system substrate-binding protein
MSATRSASPRRSKAVRLIASVLVLALVLGLVWWFFLRDQRKTMYVEFPVATGLYKDNEVRLLGVNVGKVTGIDPSIDGVRVEMKVEQGFDIPANVGAFITNRTLVADRFVELVLPPQDEREGQFQEGGTIPLERTDVPIDYDMLLTSARDLADQLAGEGELGGIRRTVEEMGQTFGGIGPEANRAIEEFAGATRVLGGSSEDIDELLRVLGEIGRMIAGRDAQIREFSTSLSVLAAESARQDTDLSAMIAQVRSLFDEVDRLVAERGGEISEIISSTNILAGVLSANPVQLAEILDTFPLIGQNVNRALDPEGRLRIRLNIASNLEQLPGLVRYCGDVPALCTGIGFTNPISFPISQSDPFGLSQILGSAVREGQ